MLTAGVACTQLFADPQQNTLAGRDGPAFGPGSTPSGTAPLQPGEAGICAPGQMRCDGALLQTCSDDLSSWVTVQRCGAAALCQAEPAACLPATCAPDEMTCSGAVLQKCNADRTGWEVFNTCLSPAHCNANQRQCLSEPCSPGDRRCDRSQSDQSPVLEVCRDDRSGWNQLDACVTRELCDQTLTSIGLGGLAVGSDGMVGIQPSSDPSTVVQCNLPACAAGETRCEGARLQFCSEGRTGWITAEECASEALCQLSAGNLGAGGAPQCVPPACATGEHRCAEGGLLQVCSEDRSGFVDAEQCIGAPFCNAALANQGQSGCTDAPCEAGQMQCNGAQIEVCRDDRTGLDPVGTPCESAALCNAGDPSNAFCEEPLCRRGATSGNEFRCEGAELQRCNESLTVYDTIQTCITPELCDSSQRLNGCRPPVCQPGQFNCANGFLQVCNPGQTGFDNVENCGSQAQCDANAGRCADPCEPGSTRCNAGNGDLERCNDRLTGWQPIADCPSLQLCDAQNARCRICVPNEFSCADGQLRQCDAEGRAFARVNIPPECALNPAGGGGIRACQGNTVVINPCPLGCQQPENRCRECNPGQTQCVGSGQLRTCGANGFYGAPTNCSNGNFCDGTETCQNNRCVDGPDLICNDEGNPCTSNLCEPASGCVARPTANSVTCNPPAGTILTCNNGNAQVTACGQLGCAPGSTVCNNCNANRCQGNTFTPCNGGRFGNAQNCPDDPGNNPCVAPLCTQSGCATQQVSGACTSGGRAGQCQQGSCRVCTPNQNLGCANGQVQTCNNTGTGVNATSCPQGQQCQNGACITPQICTPNSVTCNGNTRTVCNAQGTAQTTQNCPLGCNGTACRVQVCTPNSATCTGNTRTVCNAQGTATTTQTCAFGCNGNNCAARECDPDAPECVGNTRTICSQQGTLLGTQVCQFGCNANGGLCNTCQPNSASCTNGTRTTCNAAGTGTTTQICALGCAGTACRVCTPGTATCNGQTLSVCNAAGTGRNVTTCDPGDLCDAASARCLVNPR